MKNRLPCDTCLTAALCQDDFKDMERINDPQYVGSAILASANVMSRCSIFRDVAIQMINEKLEKENGNA